MNLLKKTRAAVGDGLDRLPPRWSGRIKRWFRLKLSPTEQLAFMNVDSLIPRDVPDSTKVLFWRGVPGRGSIYTEAIIALALRTRGISSMFIICDGAMSGCIQRTVEDGKPIRKWNSRCRRCVRYGVRILDTYGIPYVGMSELVSPQQQAEFRKTCNHLPADDLTSYEYRSITVGRFAESSTMRYLKGQPLEGNEGILREYLYSALVCCEAANHVLNQFKPARLFLQRHTEYVDWAPAFIVLKKAGLPATLWGGSLTGDRRINLENVVGTEWVSCGKLTDAVWQQRSKQPLTREEEKALDEILFTPSIAQGGVLGSAINPESYGTVVEPRKILLQELNIPDDKPVWCVFAHLTWDAGFNPDNMVFRSVFEWTLATVQAMLETKGVTWLFKSHPAEMHGTIRGVQEFVKDNFPGVGEHIRFISADSDITSNDLCSVLSGGVTLHGTSGIQLPARGIPAIVGERAHYAGKGFTCDGFTRERYLELIHKAYEIPPLSEHERKLARRYAYFLFFQHRIPINMAQGQTGYTPLDPKKLHLLFPGNDAVMDMICDRIINGGEFML